MKGVSAAAKVGVLFVIAALGLYVVWKNLSSNPAGDDNYEMWAEFKDASGLPVGSKVVVAGLPVGEISGLSIDGRYAHVSFHIRKDVPVWSSAVVYKKSTSLLGDYYLEIDPGTETAQDASGSPQSFVRLGDGDQVPRVVESTSVDQLLRRIDETLPDVDAVLASVKDLSEDLRRIVNGPVASIANNVDGLVQKEGKTIDDLLAKANGAMDRINAITKDVRAVTQGADKRVDTVLDNLDQASAEAKQLMETAQNEVTATGGAVRDKLDHIDKVISNTQSITEKIDQDRGTLGRLVNDPAIADNVEQITDDAKGFLGTLFGLQTVVTLRSEYNYHARAARNYVAIELQTRPDKYYLVELERGPRGGYPDTELTYNPTIDPNNWIRTSVIKDETRFSFQFAKRFDWLTLRYGIKESTGGVGADADVRWFNRDLHASLDVFDMNFDQLPRVKVSAALELFRFVYILGGVDELLNPPGTLPIFAGMDPPIQFNEFHYGRDEFLGAMLKFNDKDLAALLAIGGSALSSVAK